MRWTLVACLGLAACGADELAAMPGDVGGCSDNGATFTFGVDPASVERNADVALSIRWEVFTDLRDPLAVLRVGEGPVIEVEVPLAHDADNTAGFAYRGSLTNPFGLGAPAATVEVLATSSPNPGCSTSATAATAFELE